MFDSVIKKLQKGSYITLKEKRDFIKTCIGRGYSNDQIVENLSKYKTPKSELVYTINDLRSKLYK